MSEVIQTTPQQMLELFGSDKSGAFYTEYVIDGFPRTVVMGGGVVQVETEGDAEPRSYLTVYLQRAIRGREGCYRLQFEPTYFGDFVRGDYVSSSSRQGMNIPLFDSETFKPITKRANYDGSVDGYAFDTLVVFNDPNRELVDPRSELPDWLRTCPVITLLKRQ